MSAAAAHFPDWLTTLSLASLGLAVLCAVAIAIDEVRRPQPMVVMNLVWPLTALFGSVLWLAGYWRWGRPEAGERHDQSLPVAVAKGTSHCGAGCTLGDLIGEGLAWVWPAAAIPFGWRWLFPDKMFAVWGLDFLIAFVLGVAFQYYAIKPMRTLSTRDALWLALKADTASIAAWQIGMFGAMAVLQFAVFAPAFGGLARPDQPEFWFAMQAAMLCGFVTSYPVNWLLVRAGVKERM